jgi:hypothetical protein
VFLDAFGELRGTMQPHQNLPFMVHDWWVEVGQLFVKQCKTIAMADHGGYKIHTYVLTILWHI